MDQPQIDRLSGKTSGDTVATSDTLPVATDWPAVSISQAKRMLEWWSSSAAFRTLLAQDTARAGSDYRLGFDPELIRPLWDDAYYSTSGNDGRPVHPVVAAYRAHYRAKTEWRDQIKRDCASDNPRFKAWRDRQIARNTMENGPYDHSIIHAPFAIELTDGCTVGCWFCGVGATKFVESFRYTDDNARIWRGAMAALHDTFGAASRWGFCYWATDPLDNPDYERFATDFADITGMFPQTTTAQGHKDPARVRKLLQMSEARGCEVNRFSVLTEPLLRQIHAEYTPDELAKVELVAQMRGGTVPKAAAGAFREIAKTRGKVVDNENEKLAQAAPKTADGAAAPLPQPGTIACVSGFLINMVSRSIKLISPCRASDRWPLGYIIFDERTFSDEVDFRRILGEMVDAHMQPTLTPDHPVKVHPDFTVEQVAHGFRVSSPMNAIEFLREDMAAYVASLGEGAKLGQRKAGEIALTSLFQFSIPEETTMATLGVMFDLGLLMDANGMMAGNQGASAK
jgi:radical SAM family RiPP maturation amino acid epimerase